jgi:hypothetical protein
MSSCKCDVCNKEFISKLTLTRHQQKAKFCLRLRKEQNNEKIIENNETCIYCEEDFKSKTYLYRHYETCRIKKEKELKENDKKKDELINKLRDNNESLQKELNIFKMELRIKDEQLKMRDEINKKLEKEIESLKLDSKDTLKTIFEKEEKLRDTLLTQNNSMKKDAKTINNNTSIINNYGIKPFTSDCVINAFESYHLKHENAFNAYEYDSDGLLTLKIDRDFYGIVRELKDYYGITDVSREKIAYNNNGEITLTTVQEFIRKNVVMNNIDGILEWISNLRTQIFRKLNEGYTVTNNGDFINLSEYDKKELHDKQKTLMNIYELFKQSKERGDVHMYISDEMSQAAMKHGKTVEKKMLK